MIDESPMTEEFRARMRQGLSSMAVRERLRERRRNRAVVSGGIAALVVATLSLLGAQALGGPGPEPDRAAPGTPGPSAAPTAAPTAAEPAPRASSAPAEPTPPPGFEGVAAGQPVVVGEIDCGGGCGDTGATGEIERRFDVYVLCEGAGGVRYGGLEWLDCTEVPGGTGWAYLGVPDAVGDGDPQVTASDGFDGQLAVVEAGAPARGDARGRSVTAYYSCMTAVPVVVGGTTFTCDQRPGAVVELAAWGVPVAPGSFAPSIRAADPAAHVVVRWVVER